VLEAEFGWGEDEDHLVPVSELYTYSGILTSPCFSNVRELRTQIKGSLVKKSN
jgi:hypothetical protein